MALAVPVELHGGDDSIVGYSNASYNSFSVLIPILAM